MANEQNQETTNQAAQQSAQPAVNDDKAAIKADIEKMTAAVTSLETAGADLFSGAISDIKDNIKAKTDKLAVLVEKEKAAAETAVDDVVKDTETAIENAGSETTSWWVKYRYDVYVIAGLLMLGYYIFVK
ncbi:hypothetical protein [Pectinatus haikarae]|uniref:hypothetical protein n=1 Tax=Pectinatus haikarae TaxID=349096 RepID=UPI0018C4B733|nr:hypothetical protein [Pectinatus haikarae]